MKIAEIFKKKSKPDTDTSTELNDLLDGIIRIEAKRDGAKTALEAARKTLQGAQAQALDGDESGVGPAVAAVVGAKEELDGLDALLAQANSRACGLVAAGSAAQRNRLTEVETELVDTHRAIDERRIKTIASFARAHNLRVQWPDKTGAGAVAIPATVLGSEELLKIADSVVTTVHVDPDGGRLDELTAERQRLNMLSRSTPDLALQSLVAERRRKAS